MTRSDAREASATLDEIVWRRTAPEGVDAPPLREEAAADLAIIGGGFTGCSAALAAAERGASVRLIEAETIGFGGSGRNVGLVNAGLWTPPDSVEAQLGAEAGARLNAALAAAPDMVFSRIARHGIECGAVRAGSLHCAPDQRGVRGLAERHRQLSARGAPVTLLSAEEAARRTGAVGFQGALHDARAGVVNPLAYCRGLARAATQAGARLHERSPATALRREGAAWRIETAQGAIRAGALLLATNAYHLPVSGARSPQATSVGYFQLATRPLSDNLRATVLAGGEGAWDTATVMSSFRLDPAGRLLIGGVGALDHAGAGVHRAWAERKVAALFPQLGAQPIDAAWFGRIAMTADHLPKIVALGPNALSIYGYSGRGIGPGTAFGVAAGAVLTGDDPAGLPLDPVADHHERFIGVRRRYFEIGAVLTHLSAARRK